MSTISNQPDTHKNKTEKGRILTMLRYPSSCGIKDTTTTTSTISYLYHKFPYIYIIRTTHYPSDLLNDRTAGNKLGLFIS